MLRRIEGAPKLQIPARCDNGLQMLSGLCSSHKVEEHCDEVIIHYNADGSEKTQDQLEEARQEGLKPRKSLIIQSDVEECRESTFMDFEMESEVCSTESSELDNSQELQKSSKKCFESISNASKAKKPSLWRRFKARLAAI